MERKRILVVDDSKTCLFMEVTILRRFHFEVATAADGQEGLEKALADPPDLVLMDVVMPRLTGFEACRQMRAHPALRDLPIILVTTRGEDESVRTGFACGCTDYITKPINGLEMIAKVKQHLGLAAAPREPELAVVGA